MNAQDYQRINLELWNRRTAFHVKGGSYNVPAFIAKPASLKEIELGLLGDIQGQSVLHLQCHFGMDTISLSKLGAKATGLDFSDAAIEQARQLAVAVDSDAAFVCADVYDTRKVLSGQYDLVFTSYGAIGWLPDMKRWAEVVAASVKPGGRFILVEFHPFVWAFSNDFTWLEYSYFNLQPIVEEKAGTYADRSVEIDLPSVGWNHPISEVLGPLLQEGLQLTRFEEYDFSPSNCFQKTVEVAPGRFMIEGMEGKLPMVYAMELRKP